MLDKHVTGGLVRKLEVRLDSAKLVERIEVRLSNCDIFRSCTTPLDKRKHGLDLDSSKGMVVARQYMLSH